MRLNLVIIILLLNCATSALAQTVTRDAVKVDYEGIDAKQAEAIADTLSAARKIYLEDFQLDMPRLILCRVTCKPDQKNALWTDGNDHVTLTIPSKDKLDRPAKSGVYNLYGMCHELGHVAMYRTLKDRDWMTTAAAEGWAHFAGSVVVDRVWELKGLNLWADQYDYRQDGSARLTKQLLSLRPDDVTRGAGHWYTLDQLIGHKAFITLFKAWQSANIDPTNPDDKLLAALLQTSPDKKQDLQTWWQTAKPVLIEKKEKSATTAVQVPKTKLTGKIEKLAGDDGSSESKRSIAGGGHARKFTTPDPDRALVAISVHGARYGPVRAPATTFDIALCDEQLRPIYVWKKPYAAFPRSDTNWLRLDLTPAIKVPNTFYICLDFKPTASNGIYVGIDKSTTGNSQIATPGKPGQPMADGDWMIRAEIQQAKP